MRTSPTQRSLALLRKEGYTAQVVEKFNPFAHIRQDLFGFIDIVAIKTGTPGVLGVQTTTQAHVAEHEAKIRKTEAFKVWLASGNHLEIHGWAKRGKRGKRKLWSVTRKIIK